MDDRPPPLPWPLPGEVGRFLADFPEILCMDPALPSYLFLSAGITPAPPSKEGAPN